MSHFRHAAACCLLLLTGCLYFLDQGEKHPCSNGTCFAGFTCDTESDVCRRDGSGSSSSSGAGSSSSSSSSGTASSSSSDPSSSGSTSSSSSSSSSSSGGCAHLESNGGICCIGGDDTRYGPRSQQCGAATVVQWDLGFSNTLTVAPEPFFHCSTDDEWFKVDVTGAACQWNTTFRAQVTPPAGQQVAMELVYVCNSGPAQLFCGADPVVDRCSVPAATPGTIDVLFIRCDGNATDLTGTMYIHVWPTLLLNDTCAPYTLQVSACVH